MSRPLLDHALGIGGNDLYGNWAIDQFRDLGDSGAVGLAVADASTGGEGRIGGHAANDAEAGTVPDFLYVGSVKKEFHFPLTLLLSPPERRLSQLDDRAG